LGKRVTGPDYTVDFRGIIKQRYPPEKESINVGALTKAGAEGRCEQRKEHRLM